MTSKHTSESAFVSGCVCFRLLFLIDVYVWTCERALYERAICLFLCDCVWHSAAVSIVGGFIQRERNPWTVVQRCQIRPHPDTTHR